MKKVYLINTFIPKDLYDKSIKFLLPRKDTFRMGDRNMEGIYAWTDKKKILDEFFKVRQNDIYSITTIVFDNEEEFDNFKIDYKELKLDIREYNASSNYNSNNKKIKIVTTFNEFMQSTDNGSENMYEFGLSNQMLIDYNIFKNDIIESLDVINYTTEYDKHNEEDESMLDYVNYQMSFGLSSQGNKLKFDTDNEVNVLLHIFKYFFVGYAL